MTVASYWRSERVLIASPWSGCGNALHPITTRRRGASSRPGRPATGGVSGERLGRDDGGRVAVLATLLGRLLARVLGLLERHGKRRARHLELGRRRRGRRQALGPHPGPREEPEAPLGVLRGLALQLERDRGHDRGPDQA